MNVKKFYEKAELSVEKIDRIDVITASGEEENPLQVIVNEIVKNTGSLFKIK